MGKKYLNIKRLIYALGLENGFIGAYKNHLNIWIVKESIKPIGLVRYLFFKSRL